jgi:hypothetical protein
MTSGVQGTLNSLCEVFKWPVLCNTCSLPSGLLTCYNIQALNISCSDVKNSVADPDHFDMDQDPTSEKTDADPIMLYIKFCNKIFMLKNGL